jgi:hypothetical protein
MSTTHEDKPLASDVLVRIRENLKTLVCNKELVKKPEAAGIMRAVDMIDHEITRLKTEEQKGGAT